MRDNPEPAKYDLLSGYWDEVWEHLRSSGSKFHDAALDFETDTVRVWYADTMPKSLRPVVANALAHRIRIEFVRTQLDDRQLSAACTALFSALEEASINCRSIALGTPEGGPGSGLSVGVPLPDPDLQARIEALALAVVPHVQVVVVKDDRGPVFT